MFIMSDDNMVDRLSRQLLDVLIQVQDPFIRKKFSEYIKSFETKNISVFKRLDHARKLSQINLAKVSIQQVG
jgi:hypothetical protein